MTGSTTTRFRELVVEVVAEAEQGVRRILDAWHLDRQPDGGQPQQACIPDITSSTEVEEFWPEAPTMKRATASCWNHLA